MKVSAYDEKLHVIDEHSSVHGAITAIIDAEQHQQQEDAFYVCDVGDIVRKHRQWNEALPRVEAHYAVKCNDKPIVLSTLAALGTGFDCASKGELVKVLALGVAPERIIFANPAKPASHIRYANANNVQLMTFDSETELYKVKKFYPSAKLVVRIRYDAAVAQCVLGVKFGCDAMLEAPHLLQLAHSLGLDVVGVSFHVGSGCEDPPVFYKAIAAARKLFDYSEGELGVRMHLLDIGGGYPGDKGTSIDKIAYHVNRALEDFFPEDCGVRVIAEPGRFFVASAYTLVCNVYASRTTKAGDAPHTMYFINDGIYGSFNCMLYEDRKVTPKLLRRKKSSANPVGALQSSSIWGPTCDGIDVIARAIDLPALAIGDWLVFEDMGAYTISAASPFNGFPVPKVHLIVDAPTWGYLREELSFAADEDVERGDDYVRLGLDEECGSWSPTTFPPEMLECVQP